MNLIPANADDPCYICQPEGTILLNNTPIYEPGDRLSIHWATSRLDIVAFVVLRDSANSEVIARKYMSQLRWTSLAPLPEDQEWRIGCAEVLNWLQDWAGKEWSEYATL